MSAKGNGDLSVVNRKVLDYDQLVDEYRSSHNDRPDIIVTLGTVEFVIPSPVDWSDELVEMQFAAQNNPGATNPVAMAKAFLGDQYDRFKDAGGTAMHFNLVLLPAALGASVGESSAS
jgi:hypothetical protein